ncbi:hypothetical protein [Mucilaginibacter sp. FT3.2]|uniref:hypothetical protein n=1 Tax=Mucilaginibacter sp. FT3.2 TaxID=2723090 RepID=UPI00160845FD|nr:hypothetical protein [Mucilaginibacter sp. FT3.2]MBB6233820.1 hypothetical protein [Mucilaginibacter sp. FT3.2]
MDRQIYRYIKSGAAIGGTGNDLLRNHGRSTGRFAKAKEQAEVGQSPTLLALRFATRVLRILRGYFMAFTPME